MRLVVLIGDDLLILRRPSCRVWSKKMKELAGVLLVGLVVLAFLMRWDIEANHTQNSLGWDVHFKLDR